MVQLFIKWAYIGESGFPRGGGEQESFIGEVTPCILEDTDLSPGRKRRKAFRVESEPGAKAGRSEIAVC